jgi:hypothetical protein
MCCDNARPCTFYCFLLVVTRYIELAIPLLIHIHHYSALPNRRHTLHVELPIQNKAWMTRDMCARKSHAIF